MESDIVCEGYLTKAPPLDQPRSKWCYRYFTLHKTDLVLKYFKDKEARLKSSGKKGDPRGMIHLATVSRINDTSDHALANHYRHGFELETSKRLWILIADNQRDMDRWLSCLTSILGQSKRQTIVGSPNPSGSPKRSKSMLKKFGAQIGKKVPAPGSSQSKFQSIAEDSSSSSHLKHSDSSYFSQDDTIRGEDIDISTFDEDEEETITHSKSVSSHMSSADSAIGLGSDKSSKVRLTDSLPKSEQPLLDEVSQREWMLRMNQRNSSSEKVSLPMNHTNSTDTLLPSSNFIMRSQITSPTLPRGGNLDTSYNFDTETDEKTPVYDAVHDSPFDDSPAEPTYDVPVQDPSASVRKVETVTKSSSSPDEDLYDIPSNVIKSLPAQTAKVNLYDSLAPATEATTPQNVEEIYDVPTSKSNVTEVDGKQTAEPPEPLYDTPPPKRESLSGSSMELSRRYTGASVLSSSSETTSNSSYIRTTTMSIGRHNSIDSAYQMLVIDDKVENGGKIVKIEEDPIYNTPPTRETPPQPTRDTPPPPQPTRETPPPPQPSRETPPQPTRETPPPPPQPTREIPQLPQSEESIYNIPPARNTPPNPLIQQVSLPPPSPHTPTYVSEPVFQVPATDPVAPPARSPPKPYLPPRTDRPPVPSRGQTLGRPSRPPPEETKPVRPQSETMCRPNRPVPLPPPDMRDSHLVEIVLAEQTGTVSSGTLTRAKMNQREQFPPTLERKTAPENEYLEVRSTPSPPLRDIIDRPVPPPIVPRVPIGPARSSTQPLLPTSRTISTGIGLSAMSAAVGAPSTPPRIPVRAATVAGQHHNPFLEGYTPPKESTTLSRPTVQPRVNTMYGGTNMNRGATLPPPNRAATLPPKPNVLNFSKKAQDEFDAIPDSPTPTEDLQRSTSDPIQNSAPNITTSVSGNGKYPTIKNTNIGMIKVKPGYQNITEVKGALKSRGTSIQGERHGKLNRRPADTGYTPMGTMEERMQRAAANNEKQGYEPMMSHEARMANAQLNQQSARPLPPRSLAMSGRDAVSTAAHSPVYVDASGAAPSPVYVDASGAAPSPIYVDASGCAPSPIFVESGRLQAQITTDISRQPEFMRLGEIDMTLSEFLPMTSGNSSDYNHQDEYLTMESLGQGPNAYQPGQPQDDYLAMVPQMERSGPQDDYLAMGPQGDYLAMGPQGDYLAMSPQLQGDYLAMGSAAEVPDQYSNLTFSNS